MSASQTAELVPAREFVRAIQEGFADGFAGRARDPRRLDPNSYAEGYDAGEKLGTTRERPRHGI